MGPSTGTKDSSSASGKLLSPDFECLLPVENVPLTDNNKKPQSLALASEVILKFFRISFNCISAQLPHYLLGLNCTHVRAPLRIWATGGNYTWTKRFH